jgi:hypothetical protein
MLHNCEIHPIIQNDSLHNYQHMTDQDVTSVSVASFFDGLRNNVCQIRVLPLQL